MVTNAWRMLAQCLREDDVGAGESVREVSGGSVAARTCAVEIGGEGVGSASATSDRLGRGARASDSLGLPWNTDGGGEVGGVSKRFSCIKVEGLGVFPSSGTSRNEVGWFDESSCDISSREAGSSLKKL